MIGGVKVTETYENGILSSVEIIAGRRILYFSTKFEPIKCFYKKFINRMKLKGLRDAQRRQNDY